MLGTTIYTKRRLDLTQKHNKRLRNIEDCKSTTLHVAASALKTAEAAVVPRHNTNERKSIEIVEEAASRRDRDRRRKSAARAVETPETAACRRNKDKQRKSAARAVEAPETAVYRRNKDKVRKAAARAIETLERAVYRRYRNRQRKAAARAKETVEEAAARREKDKKRKAAARAMETAEKAASRREKDKKRKAATRAVQTPKAVETLCKQLSTRCLPNLYDPRINKTVTEEEKRILFKRLRSCVPSCGFVADKYVDVADAINEVRASQDPKINASSNMQILNLDLRHPNHMRQDVRVKSVVVGDVNDIYDLGSPSLIAARFTNIRTYGRCSRQDVETKTLVG